MGDQHAVHQIARLRNLARWYRDWAKLAGNPEEEEARVRLADAIEAQILRLDGERSGEAGP